MKNHLDSLKFKPKKALTGINHQPDINNAIAVANSVEINRGGILTNRHAEEV